MELWGRTLPEYNSWRGADAGLLMLGLLAIRLVHGK